MISGKTWGKRGAAVSTQEMVATRDRGARFRVDYSILDETLGTVQFPWWFFSAGIYLGASKNRGTPKMDGL